MADRRPAQGRTGAPAPGGAGAAARAEALAVAARRRRRLEAALPWAVLGAVLALWQLACLVFAIPVFLLPAPTDIAASMARWWQPLLQDSLQTLYTTVIGFLLAVLAGLLLGVAIGSSTLVYRGLYPLLIAFNSVPKAAVVPLLVIWFGFGGLTAIITAFLICFFPIVVNVATGIATVEPELRDVLRALGARPVDIIRKVGLPRAMPYFFASLKIAITLAFVGSIIAELGAPNAGIGRLMMVASSRFDTPLVFAGLVVTGVMGVVMYAVAEAIERRTIGWAVRGQVPPGGGVAAPGG